MIHSVHAYCYKYMIIFVTIQVHHYTHVHIGHAYQPAKDYTNWV